MREKKTPANSEVLTCQKKKRKNLNKNDKTQNKNPLKTSEKKPRLEECWTKNQSSEHQYTNRNTSFLIDSFDLNESHLAHRLPPEKLN